MSSPYSLRQLGEQLHGRLLADLSRTVTSEIAEVFMPVLVNSLRGQFRNLRDPQLIDSAIEDALIDYFANPNHFDPTKAGLFTYLRLRARNHLLDVLAKQTRHLASEKVVEVEVAELVYKAEAKDDLDPEALLAERDSDAQTMQKLGEILTDVTDFEMVKLMMEGIRETDCYAELLGIADRPLAEQTNIVKRHKDRLKKTVQRKYKRGRKH